MKFILLFENISQIFSTTNRIPGIFEFRNRKTKMYNLHWQLMTENCSQKNIVGFLPLSRLLANFSSPTQRPHFDEHSIELLLKILVEETIQDGVSTSTQHSWKGKLYLGIGFYRSFHLDHKKDYGPCHKSWFICQSISPPSYFSNLYSWISGPTTIFTLLKGS